MVVVNLHLVQPQRLEKKIGDNVSQKTTIRIAKQAFIFQISLTKEYFVHLH